MLRNVSIAVFFACLIGGISVAAVAKEKPAKPQVAKLLQQPSVKVVKITLAPGGILPEHTTPVHATVVALAGSGTVSIGPKKQPLTEHGAVFLPKGIPHAVMNPGNKPLVLMVHHLLTTK